jgi:hypothetical protein
MLLSLVSNGCAGEAAPVRSTEGQVVSIPRASSDPEASTSSAVVSPPPTALTVATDRPSVATDPSPRDGSPFICYRGHSSISGDREDGACYPTVERCEGQLARMGDTFSVRERCVELPRAFCFPFASGTVRSTAGEPVDFACSPTRQTCEAWLRKDHQIATGRCEPQAAPGPPHYGSG